MPYEHRMVRDDAFYEALFEPIKTVLREQSAGMYEEDLIDDLLPVVDAVYAVEDFYEAIWRLTTRKIIQCHALAAGNFLRFT
jgi:hypothetical protein